MKRLVKKTTQVKEALRLFFSRYYQDEEKVVYEALSAEICSGEEDEDNAYKFDVFALDDGSILVGAFNEVETNLLFSDNGYLYYCSKGNPYLFCGFLVEGKEYRTSILKLEKYVRAGDLEDVVWATSIKAPFDDYIDEKWKKGEKLLLCIHDIDLRKFDRFVDEASINALPSPIGWGVYYLFHKESSIDSGYLALANIT